MLFRSAHVIAMSVLVLNLRKIQCALLRMLAYLLEILAQNKNWALVQWTLHRFFICEKVPSRFGPVDKSKKTAETHSGSSRIINWEIAKDGILPSA